MKYFLSALLLIIIFSWGCEQISDPVSEPSVTIQKQVPNPGGVGGTDISYEIIPLPPKGQIYLDSIFTVSKLINGLLGGVIPLNRTYLDDRGNLVEIAVSLVIPPLSFAGNKLITLTIDDSLAAMHCEPGMTFQKPLLLLQTFTGLRLGKYDPGDIDFVYINDDGSIEEVQNSAIIVNKALGLVTVVSAQLPHFSKYGWVRRH